MKPPFQYFGNKRTVAGVIWDRLGDVQNFLDPYFGSMSILLARPPVPYAEREETVCDADSLLCNFYRAVQYAPEAVAGFAAHPVNECDLAAWHLYLVNDGIARTERLKSDPFYYDAELAGRWVWGLSQWIGIGWCGKAHDPKPVTKVPQQIPLLSAPGQGVHSRTNRGQLTALFQELQERLQTVRVCCGNWDRILGPSSTTKLGLTGVVLDPPYNPVGRASVYTHDEPAQTNPEGPPLFLQARSWALAHGDDPLMRIVLCGYEDEAYPMPDTWETYAWKASGGFSGQADGSGRVNACRERLWISPHCLKPDRLDTGLFSW